MGKECLCPALHWALGTEESHRIHLRAPEEIPDSRLGRQRELVELRKADLRVLVLRKAQMMGLLLH